MRGSLASLALLAVLILSLSAKIVVLSGGETTAKSRNAAQDAAAWLGGRGFMVTMPEPHTAPPWVSGTQGACLVSVAEVAPEGWSRSVVAQQARDGNLMFAFSGRLFHEQPVLATRLARYRARLGRYFGMDMPDARLLAIVVSSTCPVETVAIGDAVVLTK